MASKITNAGLGKFGLYHDRVVNNDPATCALVVGLLKVAESDALLQDYATFATLLAGSNTEADFTNYARKILTDADLSLGTVDNALDKLITYFGTLTWASAGGTLDNSLVKLIIGWVDDTTGYADSDVVFLAHIDYILTTDGTDIKANSTGSGYAQAVPS